MSGVGYAAAVAVAAVLAWAGVAKWRRPRGTAASFAALGLPAPAVLARAVPLAELTVAAVLVVLPRAGAVAAGGLLVAFTAVLVGALRRGGDVGCACFGAAATRPVSAADVVRNVGLLALSGAALAAESPVVPALEDVVVVSTATLLGVVIVTLLGVRRGLGRIWDNRLAGEAGR